MKKRPNILFIMTDEQKYDTFSCINEKIKTPNLDKLIENSVFFENAYCSNPSCVPSRAAMVTGKFPTVCDCPTYISTLPENERTFMSKLQESGYYTSVIGKQHFGSSSIDKGYDFEFIIDGHSPKMLKKSMELYKNYLEENGIDAESLYDADLICGGHWKGELKYYIDTFIGDTGKKWLNEYISENESKDEPKPWFCTISFPGPHQPYDGAGTKYEELYDLDDMTRNETTVEDLKSKPAHFMDINERTFIDQYDDNLFKETLRSYYANISLIDDKVGEIIALLKEKGEFDNTVIIYSSDHGDFMGDFGLVTKGQYLSEALMRVPLFIKPPIKDFKGRKVDDFVTNINIASTCLNIAGSEDKITDDMENTPYNNYWEQSETEKPEYLYMEAHDMKGIIIDKIKTVYYMNREYGELYDLKNDPLERVNLWYNDKYDKEKMLGISKILNKMFNMSAQSNIKWNTNAPSI